MKLHYQVDRGVSRIKNKFKQFSGRAAILTCVMVSAMGIAILPAASAAPNYTLYGDASIVNDGNPGNAVQLVWSPSQLYGGVDYEVPATLTVSGLNKLSTDFKFTDGTCSQGSPRFQVNVLGKNVFVYLGPQFPSLTNPCAGATYSNSTNVISPTSMVDATQLGNGYITWSTFQALHTSDAVTGVQLVVDGYTTPYITAQFDNTMINDSLYTYETKDSCKDNGWKTMTDAAGKKFKNQGDCVSYFATGGKNTASGPKKNTSMASGNLTLSNPTQNLLFSIRDNGTSAVDVGSVTYTNTDPVLTYTAPITCANISGNTAYFAYQIPANAPVAANVWVVWKVVDGATDTAGFTTAADMPGANALCEAGSAAVTNYAITAGDVVVQ